MIAFAEDPSRAFAKIIGEKFAPVIKRVVLFGSRSIGDFQADSDYDVAVFLTDRQSVRRHWKAVADAAYPFIENGTDLRPVILSFERWEERSDFLSHIRRHGTTLL